MDIKERQPDVLLVGHPAVVLFIRKTLLYAEQSIPIPKSPPTKPFPLF